MKSKLFLLDALALIYRAHFAFANTPRINSKGINTGATFGFTNTLLEIINKEKPTHLAVAFDTHAPTFRHIDFEAYKAHRQEQPEDISINIPFVKSVLNAFRIPVLEMDGFEADDIIGTLAKQYGNDEMDVYMMTSDKDYCQLVSEHVFVYRPAFMGKGPEVYNIPKVLERFSIERVDQVRDILGLQGDAADNIPGIPGIGEKTAVKLIQQFGSVENLIDQVDSLTGKLKENVKNFAAQGLQSKSLATIHVGVPIETTLESLKYQGPDPILLEAILDQLEFKQMKSKLLGTKDEVVTKKASPQQMGLFDAPMQTSETPKPEVPNELEQPTLVELKNIQTTLHRYVCLQEKSEIEELISFLSIQKEFCFDTETTALDIQTATLVGLSFCYISKEAFYIPIPEDQTEAKSILMLFKPVFENKNIQKIGHNIKFDLLMLKKYDIHLDGTLYDTMLAHYLLEPDMRHGMDVLAETYLHYKPISIEELIGKKGKTQGNMRDVAYDLITEYAAEDADITFQLKKEFEPLLQAKNLEKLLLEVETPLLKVLAEMEFNGVHIDTQALAEYSKMLETDMQTSEQKIYELAGETFNISSPKQLGVILFEKLKLEDKPKKTETGQYATGEEILSKLAIEHPIANEILSFRELQKLKSTYVDALPTLINPITGFVHTSYNQAVAATGRLSSTNPNLQNIPIRTDRGKEIRKAFIPRKKEHVIFSADYSQIELRIMAAFSKDPSMIEAFQKGIDIHSSTAAKVFGVPLEEVNSDMRRKAKMVNFGIIYGISAFGLAQRLSIPRKEAAEIIEAYFKEFPKVKSYMDEVVEQARTQEYVETILGRRRYLRDIHSRNQTIRGYAERNAINAPIQGSAADMIKVAMIQIQAYIEKHQLKTQMILQVHDELVFDADPQELESLKPVVEKLMLEAIPLIVPMEVGMGMGKNWLEAH